MAALVCDICGGKLAIGTGGIAVCDSCGMEHTNERIQEKVQEIKGVVQLDNSNMIDNWMKIGNAAVASGNNKEAYEYFTKILEADPENWRAIYEKGKAGAWQSTLGKLRISEIYQGVVSALEIIDRREMPENEIIAIKNEFAVGIFDINNAVTDLMEKNLSAIKELISSIHSAQWIETNFRYRTNVRQIEDALSLIKDFDDYLSRSNVLMFKKRMCQDLISICDYVVFYTDYSLSNWYKYDIGISEKQKYIKKFWELANDIRVEEPDFATTKGSLPNPLDITKLYFYLDRDGIEDQVYDYWKGKEDEMKASVKEKEDKKRFEEYWITHKGEKDMLDAENESLTQQIAELLSEANKVQGNIEKAKNRIQKLETEKSALGLFKSKEKKALQEQIDALTAELNTLTQRTQQELISINTRIVPLEERQSEIKNELSKPR